jgi:vacuolar-type H+-ATPase subunit H
MLSKNEREKRIRESKRKWDELHRDSKREYYKKYYILNRDRIREYRKAYREQYPNKDKDYRDSHKDESARYRREYYPKNKEKILSQTKAYYQKHKARSAETKRNNMRVNIVANLSHKIAKSMGVSLHGNKAGRKWEMLVGYTLNDLKKHLQKKFVKGMTWKRFMNGEIHIDHIIPISYFKYKSTDDIQFKECWALCNLQPLWKRDNLVKNNRRFQLPLPLEFKFKEDIDKGEIK